MHPLDEAVAYQTTHDKGISIATIAATVGRSIRYVEQRIQLLQLTDECQAAYRSGLIGWSHAFELCRLPPERQPYALRLARDTDRLLSVRRFRRRLPLTAGSR